MKINLKSDPILFLCLATLLTTTLLVKPAVATDTEFRKVNIFSMVWNVSGFKPKHSKDIADYNNFLSTKIVGSPPIVILMMQEVIELKPGASSIF